MTQYKIVTDSAGQLTKEEIERYDIYVIDLPITVDDKLYGCVNSINPTAYLRLLSSSKKPKISFISPEEMAKIYDDLGADGSEIISIHLSNRLTDSYDVAVKAAELTKTKVHVINSHMTTIGLAYQTLEVARNIEAGLDFEQIEKNVADVLKHTRSYCSIVNNQQLVNQKIIGPFIASLENRLNIRYIMEFRDDSFHIIERTNDMDLVQNYWDKRFEEMRKNNVIDLALVHSNDDNRASYLFNLITGQFPDCKSDFGITNPVMANIVGIQAIGFTYLLS